MDKVQLSIAGFSWRLFSKWQGNFSIDLNCYYKIIRQVLNVSLKASLKSVIAKMDSFGAVKKRESCHSLLLLSQGIWELHRDIYWENLLWTNPIWSLHHFRFLQKSRVTKEDGWKTEIPDLFIYPTGGNMHFRDSGSLSIQKNRNTTSVLVLMSLCR